MIRKYISVLCLLVFFSYVLCVRSSSVEVKTPNATSVHNLNTGLNYTTIQKAIDAPETSGGDVIFVKEGIYYEHVILNKSLTIIGENRTTIDGTENGTVFYVTADNVKISGFTIQNSGSSSNGIELMAENCIVSGNIIRKNGHGILLMHSSRVVITENTISENKLYGVWMGKSNNSIINRNNITRNSITGIESAFSVKNIISGNNISCNDWFGIEFYYCNNTVFSKNTIMNNKADGICLGASHANKITGNDIGKNSHGVSLSLSNGNTIFHNNFIQNRMLQARSISAQDNTWNNGYPSGGNYWSDYNGSDSFQGPFQNVTGSDGIGDTSYNIDLDNQDSYPLMGPFSDFNATSRYRVQTVCNSTISDFEFNGTAIRFNLYGDNGTSGFCRICIPTTLLNYNYKVFINVTEVPHTLLSCSNSTHSYLYFTYNHPSQEVVIISEFPALIVAPLFMITTLLVVMVYRRKYSV